MTDLAAQIAALEAEHDALALGRFDVDVAWSIGSWLRQRAAAETLPIAIQVALPGCPVFSALLPGAGPDNLAWIERKRNVVERFWESSLLTTLRCEAMGTTLTAKFRLDETRFVHSGGSVAVRLAALGGMLLCSMLHTSCIWHCDRIPYFLNLLTELLSHVLHDRFHVSILIYYL